jgi:Ca-activated chloride channel homolog
VSGFFAWPAALPVLLLAPLVALALVVIDRRRWRRLLELAGPRALSLSPDLSLAARRWRNALLAAGLLLALVAVLQPQWGAAEASSGERGIDVVVCLDVSRSMLAADMPPSRLERAKREVRALADRARGDRLGLVVFAGEPRLVVPLTEDVATFLELLGEVDPQSVERGGTDLGAALEAALEALPADHPESEAIVLVTDGEDLAGGGRRAAEACRARGVAVHAVGMGSSMGSKIPVEGGSQFLRDRDGRDVLSAMDSTSLRAIAAAAGGEFVDASASPQPLVLLHDRRLRAMPRRPRGGDDRRETPNRFQWPLAAAVGLWLLEACLGDRRPR